jgi:hypothetical protein
LAFDCAEWGHEAGLHRLDLAAVSHTPSEEIVLIARTLCVASPPTLSIDALVERKLRCIGTAYNGLDPSLEKANPEHHLPLTNKDKCLTAKHCVRQTIGHVEHREHFIDSSVGGSYGLENLDCGITCICSHGRTWAISDWWKKHEIRMKSCALHRQRGCTLRSSHAEHMMHRRNLICNKVALAGCAIQGIASIS